MSNASEFMEKAIGPCIECAQASGLSKEKAMQCTVSDPWGCPGCPYPIKIDSEVNNEKKDL